MTWTKLGDEFPAEAKDLTDAEFRTHVEGLCWSNFRLLDLHVAKDDLRRFAESRNATEAVTGLLVKGWWEDRGDSWYIGVRFADWQIERVVADKRRADTAQRQRRRRLHKAGDHSLCILGGPCPHVTRDTTRDVTRAEGRVGSGTTYPPDPEDQNQASVRSERSAANSQKPRVHHGPAVNGSSPTPADQATHVGEQPQTVTRASTR